MESLADRTARALGRHPAPAVPFREAVDMARSDGMAVTEGVLLRSLRAAPERFRVLAPWRTPGCALAEGPWLVPLGDPGPPEGLGPPCLARVRASVVWLGRTVDDRSTAAMARWLGLVREEARVREG